MISLELAGRLKDAGLVWRTANHDFFGVPDTGLDDRVFVLTDIVAYTELIRGWPVVAFHGTAEWALDYIHTSEVVWLPTEAQLRESVVQLLGEGTGNRLSLQLTKSGYACTISAAERSMTFAAATAEEAYAAALLHLLRIQDDGNRV